MCFCEILFNGLCNQYAYNFKYRLGNLKKEATPVIITILKFPTT